MAEKSKKLCDLGKRVVYILPNDRLKIGTRGKAFHVSLLSDMVSKGVARRIRRALCDIGRRDLVLASVGTFLQKLED